MMAAIRAARPDDESALLTLTGRLALFDVPAWRTATQITAADHPILLQALRQPLPEHSILVAESTGGDITGFAFSTTRQDYFTGAAHAHIEILTVAESAEGQGVGRALLQAVEDWARARGYAHVTLNVFAVNHRARAIYERNGYGQETVHYLKQL